MDAQVVKPVDREAMKRAIAMANERQHANDVLRDGKSQIDRMLATDPWHEVGSFAAYSCQMRSLGLKPWMYPPCWVGTADPDPEHHDAVALLRRLLDAGLSKYEPDPTGALAAVEARLPPAA